MDNLISYLQIGDVHSEKSVYETVAAKPHLSTHSRQRMCKLQPLNPYLGLCCYVIR